MTEQRIAELESQVAALREALGSAACFSDPVDDSDAPCFLSANGISCIRCAALAAPTKPEGGNVKPDLLRNERPLSIIIGCAPSAKVFRVIVSEPRPGYEDAIQSEQQREAQVIGVVEGDCREALKAAEARAHGNWIGIEERERTIEMYRGDLAKAQRERDEARAELEKLSRQAASRTGHQST